MSWDKSRHGSLKPGFKFAIKQNMCFMPWGATVNIGPPETFSKRYEAISAVLFSHRSNGD